MFRFNPESKLVQDYVLLIKLGKKKLDDVPEYDNLRTVVKSELAKA